MLYQNQSGGGTEQMAVEIKRRLEGRGLSSRLVAKEKGKENAPFL